MGGVNVVPGFDIDCTPWVDAVTAQPFDETVARVGEGPNGDLGADVIASTRLVVPPIDLEFAGAVAVRVDVQGQVCLGGKRRRELVGRIVPDGLGHLGRGAAVAIAAILPVPSHEAVDAQTRTLEPDHRTNVDIRTPVLVKDDLLAGAVGFPHLQQAAVFLAGRSLNRYARLLVELCFRRKALGLVPVEGDRQVGAVDLGGNDRPLVKLPSGETVPLRIVDANGISDGSVGIEFGQVPRAAGDHDSPGIVAVGDLDGRLGTDVLSEIGLQGNVLFADDRAVNIRDAVVPASEDTSVLSLGPEFEHGALGDQARLGVLAPRITAISISHRPPATLAEGDLNPDGRLKHGLEVVFGLVAILVSEDLEHRLLVGAMPHVLAGAKVVALPFREHISWRRLGSELRLLAD
ncbi:MAG: hypothetical protein BWX73_01714 [Lentisphaerae bacterium ADurb.Bin082]|nr:MAG: hypothetical protein BWX73_01714 [Lentisphaerae bacterium ADurb.Bin082]